MKGILVSVIPVLLLAAGAPAVSAQEAPGVEAGFKMWVNDWTHSVPGGESIRSDSAVLLGPAVSAHFGNGLFAEGSYLFSASDYGFSNANTFTIDRQDVDVSVGYMIIPEFGFTAGYKNSFFNDRTNGIKDRVFGPQLGVVGRTFVDEDLSFYGKLNYLITKFRQEDALGILEEDSPGWIFEFGAKLRFSPQFSGALGYKYETNQGNTTQIEDSFSGLTLGGMWSF